MGQDVPPDQAFYEAGTMCQEHGWTGMGFVMLNRYLDLSEAIEDGDASMLDNTDFVGTDIPSPYEFGKLPSEQYLADEKREARCNFRF